MDLHAGKRSRTAMVGFTLVEVLVAISVMALLATMSWRGLDSMARSQETGQTRSDELLVMQAAFAQWRTDLESLEELPATAPLDWNGVRSAWCDGLTSPADRGCRWSPGLCGMDSGADGSPPPSKRGRNGKAPGLKHQSG